MGLETSATRTATAPEGVGDWRDRLRLAAYSLYRDLGERPSQPGKGEVEELAGLIDEGRAEPSSPPTLTRVTAEALGGGICQELWFAASREGPPPESELVPMLMYAAVLPFAGPESAAEELHIPPPSR